MDPFVGMTETIRELRSLLDQLGHKPRIIELRRDVDSYVLDIERDGKHQVIKADHSDGKMVSFLVEHPFKPGTLNRIWFMGSWSYESVPRLSWSTGPSLLGRGVL